jgi:quercetin dioxygenase-like cupin family protein
MAITGHVCDNPVTGESVQWLTTAEETAGRLARAAFRVRRGGSVPAEHVHPRSEERFEVLGGTLEVDVDGRTALLHAGDRATVPAGARHAWRNAGEDDVRFVVEMEPAYGFEPFIETVFGLARDGQVDAKGMPRPLQLAVTARHFAEDIYVTGPPRWLQRLVFAVLDPIGRARGLRPTYAHHTMG